MKPILTAFLLCLATFLTAQNSSIEISAGPSFSTVNFDVPQNAPGYGFPFEDVAEKAMVGASIRLGYAQKMVGPLFLRTGLEYFSTGYGYSKDFLWPGEIVNNETYKTDEAAYTHQYLAVPVMLRLMPANKRLTPYADAGLNAGFYLQTGVRSILANETKNSSERLDEVKPFQLNAAVALGLQFSLINNSSVFLQPVAKYSLSDLTDDTPSPVFTWGLEVGGRVFLGQ
ncbi:MAG: outer membrane beta-barrel protein [Lewinellaceae bacterium]|nr:outer membrane beta-barrel protein [Lewinellaceae bacterium]